MRGAGRRVAEAATDTAQIYGNEEEVGKGIKESGLERKDVWITTKWYVRSGVAERGS